jgi:cytochrome c peroxidase
MIKNKVLLLIFLLLFSSSFKPNEVPVSNAEDVKNAFVKDLKAFIIVSHAFFDHAKLFVSDSCTKQVLIADFKKARLAYKKVEYLCEYYAPATCKLINGPFLYKTNEEEPSKAPVKPEGFQAIEDQLFAADSIDKYELETLCYRLRGNANRLYPMVSTYTFTDENIWLASRLHLLRIMAMGITGFDSPSAKLSLSEARSSFESIRNCWKIYADKGIGQNNAWLETEALFAAADKYLVKNNKYSDFNRLEFIIFYINPLYQKGFELLRALDFKFLNDPTAIDQSAKNIFYPSSWNADYFRSERVQPNPLKEKRAALGKLLFFDPIISENGKRSCASCHNPQHGFSENLSKSVAMNGKSTIKRNAPTLLNVGLQANLFADARSNFLEDQIQDVVFAEDELHGNFKEIAIKLRSSTEYRRLFKEAFAGNADSEITSYSIIKSIAEYERTLLSFNSRFDQYVNGNKKALHSAEIRGFNIFSGKGLCASCHFVPLFNGTVPPMYYEGELEVLGVPENPYAKVVQPDKDLGRRDVTGIPWQNGSFKTPTVRNVELTAPYMHNGAYKTLEDVVDFYNKGGGRGMGLDVPNQTLPFDKLNLTKQEQKDLVSFMKALTDTTGLTSKPTYLPEIEGFTRKIGGEY